MTHVATMGTSSCATIAIGGFKGQEAMDINEAFKAGADSKYDTSRSSLDVNEFYSKILHPLAQVLGRTKDMPFTELMQEVDKSYMKSKFIIATLNDFQRNHNNEYWPKELAKFGFEWVDETKNDIGMMCHVYVRSNNRPTGTKIGVIK